MNKITTVDKDYNFNNYNFNCNFIDDLYKNYSQNITRYCSLFCKSESDVSDCVQETFVIAIEKIEKLKNEIKNPKSWLYKIAKNVIFNANRRNQRQTKRIKNIDDYIYNDLTDDNCNEGIGFITYKNFEDDFIIKTEDKEFIEQIHSQLTEAQWIRFNESYMQKMTPMEISEIHNKSYSSVTTELYKLKKKLIKIINKIDK